MKLVAKAWLMFLVAEAWVFNSGTALFLVWLCWGRWLWMAAALVLLEPVLVWAHSLINTALAMPALALVDEDR